ITFSGFRYFSGNFLLTHPCLGKRCKFNKKAGAGSGHARLEAQLIQKQTNPPYAGIFRQDNRLEIIAAKISATNLAVAANRPRRILSRTLSEIIRRFICHKPISKDRHYEGRRISCQIRMRKNRCRRNGRSRFDNDIGTLWHRQRGKPLSDAFREGRPPEYENGYVRAQRQRQPQQLVARQACAPEPVQRNERRRRIAGAASQAAARRYGLAAAYARPLTYAARLAQGGRRPEDQVVFRRDTGQRVFADDPSVVAQRKIQPVAQIDETKRRLQQ